MPNLKSDVVTAVDGNEGVDGRIATSDLREGICTLNITAGAYAVGDALRLFRIPANARITELINLDGVAGFTGGAAPDVGVYLPGDGAVVDADGLGTDITMTAASANLLDAVSDANSVLTLKELLGRENESDSEYDIAISIDTAVTLTAQTPRFRIRYVI